MAEEAGHSATNMATVHLWQALGFQIFATVPEAFDHPEHGLVGPPRDVPAAAWRRSPGPHVHAATVPLKRIGIRLPEIGDVPLRFGDGRLCDCAGERRVALQRAPHETSLAAEIARHGPRWDGRCGAAGGGERAVEGIGESDSTPVVTATLCEPEYSR